MQPSALVATTIVLLIIASLGSFGVLIWNLRKIKALTIQARHVAAKPELSASVVAQLQEEARQAFETTVTDASLVFSKDLSATSARLAELVNKLTTSVVEDELQQYHKVMEGARQIASQTLKEIQEAVEQQRQALKATVDSEMQAERARLLEQFDHRLSDVVSSYIVEALGQGVDLGAQSRYLVARLEEHKDELKKDLLGDV